MTTNLKIRDVLVTDDVLDPMAALELVQHGAAGAGVLFTGVVRDHDGGRDVVGLEYSAHPSAQDALRQVTDGILADHPAVRAVVAHHRTGPLDIGDIALVVAVSTAHRGASFAACEELVERIKATVPIWKHQRFGDGTGEWVNSP